MAIEGIAEEVATNLEEVAEVTRRINTRSVGFFLGGVAVGVSVGFYFGHRWNREKIRAEAFRESKEELDKIREVYQTRTVIARPKPSVDEVIEERGYSTPEERPLKAPVPISQASVTAPPVIYYEGGKSKDEGWNYPEELANRTADYPYVIHQDEFKHGESEYAQSTYTYYSGDGVLVDDDNIPLPHADLIIGQDNLKWGHGTDDIDVVFVRNDKLEMEMEICRSPKSYEQEVLGYDRNETD